MRNLPPSGRLLLLGLDGGEWTLIRRWAKEGLLPTFKRLLEEGAFGELRSIAAQFLDTAWPCLYTGLNPGKLDKYFYIQLLPGTLRLSHVTDDAPCAPSFWELLSEAGYRVGVVDAPKFPVSENLINHRGREPDGTVRPDEYDAVCRDLADAFLELRDPDSGQPVVRLVTKSREVFHGPFLNRLPDLTVLWNTERPWTALESPRIGRLRVLSQDVRTGGHTPRGFVIVKGQGVPSGAEWIGHSILDLARTFLVAAGVEPSRSMDGRPLPFCSS
jgi:predicted AlkP superfamily phosphohydrolase/phosphomutase